MSTAAGTSRELGAPAIGSMRRAGVPSSFRRRAVLGPVGAADGRAGASRLSFGPNRHSYALRSWEAAGVRGSCRC
jgi:hypothetical protein